MLMEMGENCIPELALDAINYYTTTSKIDYKEEANKSTCSSRLSLLCYKYHCITRDFYLETNQTSFHRFLCVLTVNLK